MGEDEIGPISVAPSLILPVLYHKNIWLLKLNNLVFGIILYDVYSI